MKARPMRFVYGVAVVAAAMREIVLLLYTLS